MPSGTSDSQREKAGRVKGPSYSGASSAGWGVRLFGGSCGVQQPEHSRTPALLALVHFHGNSSQPCTGWCAPSISMAPITMAPTCSEKHRLKTEHKEKGAIHFPAITSPTAVVLLKAHVDLFRSKFPCFWCRWP